MKAVEGAVAEALDGPLQMRIQSLRYRYNNQGDSRSYKEMGRGRGTQGGPAVGGSCTSKWIINIYEQAIEREQQPKLSEGARKVAEESVGGGARGTPRGVCVCALRWAGQVRNN